MVGPVSVYCDWVRWRVGSATSISVRQHVKLSEQMRPWDTLACCWDVKQPTNNKQQISQDGTMALRKDHARSAKSWGSLTKVVLETVVVWVWLNTNHSRSRKAERLPLPFSTIFLLGAQRCDALVLLVFCLFVLFCLFVCLLACFCSDVPEASQHSCLHPSSQSKHRLVGLMVKSSALAADLGSIPLSTQIFFEVESHQWLKNWYSSGYPARRLAL